MSSRRHIFAVAVGLAVCLGLVWHSGLIQARSRTYELRPEIRLPEHRTDAGRAIDAYERLMERYMTLTEKNLSGINVDMKGVGKKLDSIDGRLAGLSTRMARIEKALGIELPEKKVLQKAGPKRENREDDGSGLKSSRELQDKAGKGEVASSYSL